MGVSSKKPLLLSLDLEHSSVETVVRLLDDRLTDGHVLDRIAKLYHGDQALMERLLNHPRVTPQILLFLYGSASEDFKKRIQRLKKDGPIVEKALVPVQDPAGAPTLAHEGIEEDGPAAEKRTLYQRIQGMKVAEKVQFALRAGKDARSLLLKDPNLQVALAVLASPKITEDEILVIAQSRNVSDEILRMVAKNKDWLKNYSILFALVGNPKTPIGASLPLLHAIKTKDLGLLSKNRNIPEAIRTGASRLLFAKQKQS
ncbi:MAG: hypothetical protein HY204_08175 [Nitrospirae bacterium]|nr:hypothetical protein [Nitrospirota bacterium]